MTEALDAMVKAMAAALWAQINTESWDPAEVYLQDLDLEKVARAGLEAIREPPSKVRSAVGAVEVEPREGCYTQPIGDFAAGQAIAAMIDKILEVKP